MNLRLKEGLRAVGFMFTLSLVLITCIAVLSVATAEKVHRNADLFLQRAVMAAVGLPVPADPAAVAAWFHAAVEAEPPVQPSLFRVHDRDHGNLHALVFKRQAKGLWGTITAVVGFDPTKNTFLQTRFLDHNETPGLGARINEEWFMQQTVGKRGPFKLTPEGTHSDAPTEIDAITGATITSAAVRDMLNALLPELPHEKEALP